MFSKLARTFTVTLAVFGLAFGALSATAPHFDTGTIADSGGQNGEWDVG